MKAGASPCGWSRWSCEVGGPPIYSYLILQPPPRAAHPPRPAPGFKVFTQRTVVGPLDGFTCVMGANGSGKSVLVSNIERGEAQVAPGPAPA